MRASAIREAMKLAEQPGVISFAAGMPSSKVFPIERITAACERVLRRDGSAALQYAASEGFAPLIDWVVAHLSARGLHIRPEQIIITNGSQQGLDLVAKSLVDPGSPVLVETPTYVGALQSFAPYEPELIGVACDVEGPLSADLAARASALLREGRAARFLYLLPTYQNPSGRCISPARRADLAGVAALLNLPVVEDDPYADLWYDEPPPAPVATLLPEGTVYLGSFSKILAPGLRLGYLAAPLALVPRLLQGKTAADLHTATFNQRIALEALGEDFLAEALPAVRHLYRERRDMMLTALERAFPDRRLLDWTRPGGGMFIWARLPQGWDAAELLPLASSRGVAYVPGAAFHAGIPDPRTLRLSFVTVEPSQIDAGVTRLAEVIREAERSAPGIGRC
ncbi:DNA-binding transcriptional regulator, MocR family, contains an aminotransferase domain [Thiomonas bhubaneswarensis]|uniref:DNA-binding transcriptional regulator, MocR family, contains an aminotransferase domain n=2 Tax=Thiomonas bhubaneswarensis TaxID=339866 RepID=A0A0K6HZR2_9BURK|nr:DNA-binding transcriptional regulator, MocR family, contains an aminotransferase domain [Thiomonas bhubaneswarensis]